MPTVTAQQGCSRECTATAACTTYLSYRDARESRGYRHDCSPAKVCFERCVSGVRFGSGRKQLVGTRLKGSPARIHAIHARGFQRRNVHAAQWASSVVSPSSIRPDSHIDISIPAIILLLHSSSQPQWTANGVNCLF